MKSTKDLLDEGRGRAKTRFAERKGIEARSFSIRRETQCSNDEIRHQATGHGPNDKLRVIVDPTTDGTTDDILL